MTFAWADVLRAFSPVENLRRVFFRGGSVGEKHLAPLDGLRGLALIWVLLVHVGWYGWFSFAPGVPRCSARGGCSRSGGATSRSTSSS